MASEHLDETYMSWRNDIISKRDFSDPNILKIAPYKNRRTPFMASVSDPNLALVDLQKLIEAGVNIVKLKLSNSTIQEKIKMLDKIVIASKYLCCKYNVPEWPLATSMGLKTSVVKTGIIEEDIHAIPIKTGSDLLLTNDIAFYNKCNNRQIFVDNPDLLNEVDVGMEITILTPKEIVLQCTEIINKNTIKCAVTKGGNLRSLSMMIVRSGKHCKPLLTKHDMDVLKFALEYKIDILVINYVRSPETLRKIKTFFGNKTRRPLLLSYISTEDDLKYFKEILKESDGIFFSRDFIPFELEVAKKYRWMQIQKWAAAKCMQAGKPFFISGGVLQGACLKGCVWKNEVADVTNAVLDGATGFVLNDWNNIDSLVEAIKLLHNICTQANILTASFSSFAKLVDQIKLPVNAAEACMIACVAAAFQTNANVIIIPTVTGQTVKSMCRLRPPSLIIAITNEKSAIRMLHAYRGVVPLKYFRRDVKTSTDIEKRIEYAVEFAVARKFLTYGDTYVTLRRGSATSFYCDTVEIRTTSLQIQSHIECVDETDPLFWDIIKSS